LIADTDPSQATGAGRRALRGSAFIAGALSLAVAALCIWLKAHLIVLVLVVSLTFLSTLIVAYFVILDPKGFLRHLLREAFAGWQ
jgi:hypothetical protein